MCACYHRDLTGDDTDSKTFFDSWSRLDVSKRKNFTHCISFLPTISKSTSQLVI